MILLPTVMSRKACCRGFPAKPVMARAQAILLTPETGRHVRRASRDKPSSTRQNSPAIGRLTCARFATTVPSAKRWAKPSPTCPVNRWIVT